MNKNENTTMSLSTLEQVKLAAQAIYDKKGQNILALDLTALTSVTDYVLVAEGSIGRHNVALANEVIDTLNDLGIKPFKKEGLSDGDWVALDYSDFIVHILKPDLRAFYQIERIWPQAKIIDINLEQIQK
ncbi:MAG: ribosome silencing factor [Rhabdochlamydiaceae bacterium]|nr:ribosome silencing factor [Candidatus Amphrikana amoebophyrae]